MQVITRRQCPWITSYEIMFVNYFWCKGFGRNHRDNGEFFPWTGSAHVMIITPFPTRPPPNWPLQLQTPSCGPGKCGRRDDHRMLITYTIRPVCVEEGTTEQCPFIISHQNVRIERNKTSLRCHSPRSSAIRPVNNNKRSPDL